MTNNVSKSLEIKLFINESIDELIIYTFIMS